MEVREGVDLDEGITVREKCHLPQGKQEAAPQPLPSRPSAGLACRAARTSNLGLLQKCLLSCLS